MAERGHVRQRYREEFEQIGEIDLRKRLEAGQFDDDKRKAGWAWLDDKAHGEERAYRARQLALQERNDLKTSISLGFALVALIISVSMYSAAGFKTLRRHGHHAEAFARRRRSTIFIPLRPCQRPGLPPALLHGSGSPAAAVAMADHPSRRTWIPGRESELR